MNETVVINGVKFNKLEIAQLLEQGKYTEVIAMIEHKTHLDLDHVLSIVENFDIGNYDIENMVIKHRKKTGITIEKDDTETIIRYIKNDQEYVVTPNDLLWKEVKQLYGDNEYIQQYENTYSKTNQKNKSVRVIYKNKSKLALGILLLLISILLLIYYINL